MKKIRRHLSKQSQQGGYAFVLILFIILLVAGSIITHNRSYLIRNSLNNLPVKQQAYVDDVAEKLLDWYQKNLFSLDKDSVNFDANQVIDLLGIKRKWDVRAAMTPYYGHQNKIFARSIVVWLASQGGATSFDGVASAMQVLPKNVTQKTVSTSDIQIRAYQHSQSQLKQIALLMEAYFSAHSKIHSHIYSANRFVPRDCSQVRPTEIAGFCSGNKQSVSTILMQLGADSTLATNPWGGVNHYEIQPANASQSIPRIKLSTTTPWGNEVVVFATAIL